MVNLAFLGSRYGTLVLLALITAQQGGYWFAETESASERSSFNSSVVI
jgi:hypothetical protein